MRTVSAVIVFALLLLTPSWAHADPIIFDKGLTASQQSSSSSAGATGALTNFTQADQFTMAAGVVLTDIHFWTLEATTALQPSVIQYYVWNTAANGADADTGLLASGAVGSTGYSRTLVRSGVTTANYDRWYYEFNLSAPYTFTATGQYWLGLHFGASNVGGVAMQAWEYSASNDGTDVYYRVLCSSYGGGVCGNFGNWAVQGSGLKDDELAFQLTGTAVPEPASLLLLGTGLIGAVRAVRKRRG